MAEITKVRDALPTHGLKRPALQNEATRITTVVPILMGPLLLLTWHPPLFSGANDVPRRSIWGLIGLTLLAAAYFATRWRDGVTYQGAAYTMAILSLNVVALAVGWGMLWRASRRRSFGETLAAHTVVVGWLVSIAFPWLGEFR